MPCEVRITDRADQQLANLFRGGQRAFDHFVTMLAAQGCAALTYRLTGDPPTNHFCVKHLEGRLRVIVAFETNEIAWIALIGEHDERSPTNIYGELYELLGVGTPDAERTKPPCCDEVDQLPPLLGTTVGWIANDTLGPAPPPRPNTETPGTRSMDAFRLRSWRCCGRACDGGVSQPKGVGGLREVTTHFRTFSAGGDCRSRIGRERNVVVVGSLSR